MPKQDILSIFDRIDIHIEIKLVKYEALKDNIKSKSSISAIFQLDFKNGKNHSRS